MNDDEILRRIEASYSRMSRLPEKSAWKLPTDELNPGSFKPQDQVVHALPVIDQTRNVTRSPGGTVDSNGQGQTLDFHHLDDGVKAVFGAPMLARHFDGQAQSINLHPLDQGVSSSAGTSPAYSVNVSSQNLHRAPTSTLPALPTLIRTNNNPADLAPGTGIATTVHIK